MNIRPIEIKRNGRDGIDISWNDGSHSALNSATLRKWCPCAGCKELRGDASHSKPLTNKTSSLKIITNTIETELELKSIWGVGQYALGLEWGDGHSTGIYTYEYLLKLGEADEK